MLNTVEAADINGVACGAGGAGQLLTGGRDKASLSAKRSCASCSSSAGECSRVWYSDGGFVKYPVCGGAKQPDGDGACNSYVDQYSGSCGWKAGPL